MTTAVGRTCRSAKWIWTISAWPGGRLRTYRNLMLTMLLGGLWHGARLELRDLGSIRERCWAWSAWAGPRVPPTLCIFRAATFGEAAFVLHQMASFPAGQTLWPRWQRWLAIMLAALAIAEERLALFERLAAAPAWAWSLAVAVLLFCEETLGVPGQAIPFVYFQF